MDERQQTSRPSRSLGVNLDTDIKPDATPTISAMRAADAGSIETLGSRWMRDAWKPAKFMVRLSPGT